MSNQLPAASKMTVAIQWWIMMKTNARGRCVAMVNSFANEGDRSGCRESKHPSTLFMAKGGDKPSGKLRKNFGEDG
jgi:hypothetical protein